MKKILLSLSALFCLLNANAQVIEKVNYVGALSPNASKDWTKDWTNWDPKNANYGAVSDSTTLNDASGEKATQHIFFLVYFKCLFGLLKL